MQWSIRCSVKDRVENEYNRQLRLPELEFASGASQFELESVLMTRLVEADPPKWNSKALGAYYTDSQVADFLVWWSVRQPTDTVLDPSFGGGVFLRSAAKRLRQLSGGPERRIFGVELDPEVHLKISELLRHEFGIAAANLLQSDFFEIAPEQLNKVDVVVGNPPFIRYQRFTGDIRKRALTRAAEQGLKLSQLSSSWLPFLVHSTRFLREGGRLAMVIPFEIGHATYARSAIDHLAKIFDSITFLTFRKKLFPDLSEDTLLLLAEGRQKRGRSRLYIRDLAHAGGLADIQNAGQHPMAGLRRLNTERVASGEERLIEALIPSKARDLYRELRQGQLTMKLGEIADVGIGYVTGANDFFHLGRKAAEEWKIPGKFLRPCVRRGSELSGLRLTQDDWEALLNSGQACYLLQLPTSGSLPETVNRYLARGKHDGVHKAFKCRTRSPWYRVPHVHQPDGFLTYMSGNIPRLVANDAGVVAPNTLHILRMNRGSRISNDGLAALWRTSLTHLSVEIEGHALGGGMLKLEPGEAEQVLVPWPAASNKLGPLVVELDEIARSKGEDACGPHANQHLLRRGLGLSDSDIRLLLDSAKLLRERRMSRNAPNELS
jgi:adenine-specific DNA-methyltransferase